MAESTRLGSRLKKPDVVTIGVALIIVGAMFLAAVLVPWERREKLNTAPVAVVVSNVVGYVDAAINFDTHSYDPDIDGQIINYTWDFGDGSFSYEKSPAHIYRALGNYTVTLTVVDDNGATGSDSITVKIVELVTQVLNELLTNTQTYKDTIVTVVNATVTDAGSYAQGYGADSNSWVNFKISDNSTTQTLTIYCESGATRPLSLAKYDIVNVQGIFFWYATGNYWELKVRRATEDNVELVEEGSVSSIQDYTNCTISELLLNSSAHEDELVAVINATVTDAGSYAQGYGEDPSGWVNFKISDSSTTQTLTVYCEGSAARPLSLAKYDIVNVQGIFFWYETGNYWELKVRKSTNDSVELGAPPEYTTVTISALLYNPTKYENTNVSIETAIVSSGYETVENGVTLAVHDSSTNTTLTVFIENNVAKPSVSRDGIVNVQGLFRWNNITGGWEIWIRNSTTYPSTHDGVEIPAPPEYAFVTIAALVYNPMSYKDTDVRVENVSLSEYYRSSTGWTKFTITGLNVSSSLIVYCERYSNISNDLNNRDTVNIQGLFTWYYQGYWEIMVRNKGTALTADDKVERTGRLPPEYVTIAVVQADENGDGASDILGETIAINGTVTGIFSDSFYVQDSTGGVMIYNDLIPKCNVSFGDAVDVEGTVTEYSNETELKDIVNITIKGAGIMPKPAIMSTGNAVNEINEGQLIKVAGTVGITDTYGFYINDGSGEVYVYIHSSTGIDFTGIASGNSITVMGIGSQYKEKHEVKPRYQSDIVKGTMVDIAPLVPVIRISPETPTHLEDVTIAARVTDDYSVVSVVINYTADNWLNYNNVEMLSSGTVEYQGKIPAQQNWTTVNYNIIATDNSTQKTTTAEKSYTVTAASPWTDHVVISEVLYYPKDNDPTLEWVELYNPTANDINISGWGIEHLNGEDGGLIGSITLPNAIIKGYGFYLLGSSTKIEPKPDYIPDFWFHDLGLWAPGSANKGYTILIRSLSGIVVDMLGYGESFKNSTLYEGMPKSDVLAYNYSLEREPGTPNGNGNDTNNNKYDFTVRASPNPQNSSYTEIPEFVRTELSNRNCFSRNFNVESCVAEQRDFMLRPILQNLYKNKETSGRFVFAANNKIQNYSAAKFE